MGTYGENGNVFLTDDIILHEIMEELISSCVAVKRVNRQLEKSFTKRGDTISVEKPFMTQTAEGRTLAVQPMTDTKVPFTIDRQRNFGLKFNQRDRSLNMRAFKERYLNSGIRQLGNDIEQSILQCAVKKGYRSYGSPGTALSSDIVTDIDGRMTEVAIPEDGMRSGIINTRDGKSIDKEMKGLYNPAMVKSAIERGYMGPISEMQLYRTAMMPVHTVGNHGGTPLIKGANQTGSSLVIDGGTNSTTKFLVEGDTFTIAGVYEVHPQTKQSTGELQRFVVKGDVDTSGTGTATLSISPAINDGSSAMVTTNGAGESVSLAAYQNVSNAPADNAAITVIGEAGKSYRQNVFFHKNALTLCMAQKELPESAVVKSRVTDPDSGLSLCMTAGYDVVEDEQTYRVDAIWGVDALQAELLFRNYSSLVG
ncbi:MAG: hypothetical protein HGB17_00155 [Syntrophobacteraceae bacterium]|nr:hypothetical protein [Syntrophobacteraceae bacterium]